MNGAESLVLTLLKSKVNVCFANPGTSEMHFVAALDRITGMRCVLGLFEGVVTGAADGYFRIARKPACTLLHLGPGLANGLANLHNAKKAKSGIVNIVGEHALNHLKLEAPLTSDINGIAQPVSQAIYTPKEVRHVGQLAASAVASATNTPPEVSTLILPADMAWKDGGIVGTRLPPREPNLIDDAIIKETAETLQKREKSLILLGGNALTEKTISVASRVASKTGAKLLSEWANARMDRGRGVFSISRIPYIVDQALSILQEFKNIILVDAQQPVAFFAYPNKPGVLAPSEAKVTRLCDSIHDIEDALLRLEDKISFSKINNPAKNIEPEMPSIPTGQITSDGIACVLANFIPENSIIVDESITTGRNFFHYTANSARHTWLNNKGGSIGFGLPLAVGASVAAPSNKVIVLESDGSAMYTNQALWTMARENLNITILIFSNRSYKILFGELKNVGLTSPGKISSKIFSLRDPDLNWVSLSLSMGVDAKKVSNMAELSKSFIYAMEQKCPYLIEVEL